MNYVIDENNNKKEAFDKEETLAALEKAIEDGSLAGITADSAFVSKLKCCVSGVTNQVAFVTQAKYNEMEAAGLLTPNTLYFITDDTTADDLENRYAEAKQGIDDAERHIEYVDQMKADRDEVYIVRDIGTFPDMESFLADVDERAEGSIYVGKDEAGQTNWVDLSIKRRLVATGVTTSKYAHTGLLFEYYHGPLDKNWTAVYAVADGKARDTAKATKVEGSGTNYWKISQAGLYAVSVKHSAIVYTVAISVFDLATHCNSSSAHTGDSTHQQIYVGYDNSMKWLTAYNGEIVDVRLISAY